jgi:hypothetical protein
MSAILNFHIRRGVLTVAASGKTFQLTTQPPPLAVSTRPGASFEKSQTLAAGKYTLWDHCFETPHQSVAPASAGKSYVGVMSHGLYAGGNAKFDVYDYPGDYAQRFDGVKPSGGSAVSRGALGISTGPIGGSQGSGRLPHPQSGPVIYVGDGRNGVHIHGWPPCTCRTCIVVIRQWEEAAKAIAGEQQLSFSIER